MKDQNIYNSSSINSCFPKIFILISSPPHCKCLGKNKNMVTGPDRALNQEMTVPLKASSKLVLFSQQSQESPTLLSSQRRSHFRNINGLGKNKNMVMGPKTKNDCAGKAQQQILLPCTQYPRAMFSRQPARTAAVEHRCSNRNLHC